MQNLILIILSIAFLAVLILLYLMYKKLNAQNKPQEGEKNLFVMLQNQIQELNRTVDEKISNTHKIMGQTKEKIDQTGRNQSASSIVHRPNEKSGTRTDQF